MSDRNLRIERLNPGHYSALKKFFKSIERNQFFHPHDFNEKETLKRSSYIGDDLYYVLIADCIIGYGFIRGWDAGWKDKCIGLIIDEKYQGNGYGRLLLLFLHAAAKMKKIKRLRLHVHPENKKAINLYEKTGYKFTGIRENGEKIGICIL